MVISAPSEAGLSEVQLNGSQWSSLVCDVFRWWISRPEERVSAGQLQYGKARTRSRKSQRRNLRSPVSVMRCPSHTVAGMANTILPTGNTAK